MSGKVIHRNCLHAICQENGDKEVSCRYAVPAGVKTSACTPHIGGSCGCPGRAGSLVAGRPLGPVCEHPGAASPAAVEVLPVAEAPLLGAVGVSLVAVGEAQGQLPLCLTVSGSCDHAWQKSLYIIKHSKEIYYKVCFMKL